MIRRFDPFNGLVFCWLALCIGPIAGFAQDAPQPQPAPGLTRQPKTTTAPSAAQQTQDVPPPSTNTQTKIIPASAERHFRQAVLFEHDGNAENAIEEYKAAIKDYPDYFEAHLGLGYLYLNRHGYSEAITELKTAVSLRPDDANAHFNLGLALKSNRDLNGAIAEYHEAIRLNPRFANAHNNLANVLYMKRDFAGAIQQYRSALDLMNKPNPNQRELSDIVSTRMNLGSVLDAAGKSDEAVAEYKAAIALQPGNANVHYNLALLYKEKMDMPSAVAELRQAAKLAPDWPTPHIMLARLLKDSDPKAALDQCVIADGLTQDAKLHDLCGELQKKSQ